MDARVMMYPRSSSVLSSSSTRWCCCGGDKRMIWSRKVTTCDELESGSCAKSGRRRRSLFRGSSASAEAAKSAAASGARGSSTNVHGPTENGLVPAAYHSDHQPNKVKDMLQSRPSSLSTAAGFPSRNLRTPTPLTTSCPDGRRVAGGMASRRWQSAGHCRRPRRTPSQTPTCWPP